MAFTRNTSTVLNGQTNLRKKAEQGVGLGGIMMCMEEENWGNQGWLHDYIVTLKLINVYNIYFFK
jgi:hypothetical protein